MRKSVIGLASLLTLGVAAPSFALYAAHQAARTAAPSGDCSACHIPHKSPATSKRGFPITPGSTNTATYGFIGAFCIENCHNPASKPSGTFNVNYADVTNSVMAGTFAGGATGTARGSHGMNLLNAGANAPSSTVVSNTLPYGGNTQADAFECTTCHNVHDNAAGDTSNALLMEDIDTLCDTCHTNRGAGDAVWATGYGTANTIGHPVGTDVDNDAGGGTTPIRVGIGSAYGATAFDAAYGIVTQHNLGGHLINGATGSGDGSPGNGTSPVGCVTCHAVHGIQADPGDSLPTAGGSTIAFEDLLVIQQGNFGTAEPTFRANGQGDASNALCEGCHVNKVGAAAATGSAWNPGGTAFAHPVDAMNDSDSVTGGTQTPLDMGTLQTAATLAASGWPFGSATGLANIGMGTGTERVICESCHQPHGTANGQAAGTTDYALRDDVGALCDRCHTGTPTSHHPVGAGLMGGTTGMGSADIGNNDTTLSCNDCHGGSANNGAHNWTIQHFPSLDTNWEPAGNGLNSASDVAGGAALANTSKECTDCHFNITNGIPSARHSPTTGSSTAPGDGTLSGSTAFTDMGDASHFLGLANITWANGYYRGATFNAQTTAFPVVAGRSNGGWTRFAGASAAARELVCESCHELQPTRNINFTRPGGTNPLLLAMNTDGDTAATGVSTERYAAEFCEACHGQNPGGNVTHPLTGSTVTKASDLGLTPTTLITASAAGRTTYAAAATRPSPGLVAGPSYPVANSMNCDSCHQVHNADTQSGTFILEVQADANVTATTPRDAAVTLYGGSYTRTTVAGSGMNYAAFCTLCHAY